MNTEDQLKKGEIVNLEHQPKMEEQVKEHSGLAGEKDAVQISASSTTTGILGPATPDSHKESGDFFCNFTSPLTLVSSPPKVVCFESNQVVNNLCLLKNDPPLTPKCDIFDPFAPGPDILVVAPHSNKHQDESRVHVARRLDFDFSISSVGNEMQETDAGAVTDEKMILEAVYGTLLEAIISNQTEGLHVDASTLDPILDGLKTPTSARGFSADAEFCPGAPVKPTRKSRVIPSGLCRKLEF